jgi:(E)-4-hydroxy-3-methylbut-2-enyl-diphosphate synthase
VVEKVRINPGNYIDPARKFKQIDYTNEEYQAELERLRQRFVQLLNICKEHKTALRIGVNHGSLSDRIMSRYGDTPEGMVESCMEFLRVAVAEDFKDIVLSIKASNTRVMVTTVRLLVWQMQEENMMFPLHLGVTEAGEGEDGRVKSAVGIGALLADGIGDTIRVSLSEAPEKELPVAKALVDYFADEQSIRYAETTQVKIEDKTIYFSNADTDWALFQLHAAAECGRLLWDYNCTELVLNNDNFSADDLLRLSKDILQAARVRMYKTEYISCPGCGRTLFELEQTIAQVKAATAHLQGLKIGIMGCIVNGPGEMADADYGYVGAGRGKISLYRGKECVLKNIPQEEAVEQLLALIEADKQ